MAHGTADAVANRPKDDDAQWEPRRHWRLLAACCSMSVCVGINDGAIGFMIPQFKDYYGISYQTLSVLFLANSSGYILFAPTYGLLVRTWGAKVVLMTAGFLAMLAYLMIMQGFPFVVTCLLMVVQGIGVAILDAGMNVCGAQLPMATLMLNIIHALYGFGAMLSPLVGSFILENELPWPWLYGFMTSVSLLNVLVLALGIPTSSVLDSDAAAEEMADVSQPEQLSAKQLITRALFNWATMLCAIYIFIYVGLEVILGGWGYAFLVDGKHGDPVSMSRVISMYWAALAIGRLLLGYVTSRYGEKRTIIVYMFITMLGLVGLLVVNSLAWDAVMFVIMGTVLGPMYPTTISILSKSLSKELLPTSIGFIGSIGGLGIIQPSLAGVLAGLFGILYLPYLCLAMIVVMQIVFFFFAKVHVAH
ncbi:major facilitator superfamily domain-containing protein [Gongronella butleri]|nr:major facilitator superfamily domain-containing protein [Gongronella butleri]